MVRGVLQLAEWTVWLDPDAVVVVLGVAARPDPARAQTQKHRPDQLAKGGGVHRLLSRLKTKVQYKKRLMFENTTTMNFGNYQCFW